MFGTLVLPCRGGGVEPGPTRRVDELVDGVRGTASFCSGFHETVFHESGLLLQAPKNLVCLEASSLLWQAKTLLLTLGADWKLGTRPLAIEQP